MTTQNHDHAEVADQSPVAPSAIHAHTNPLPAEVQGVTFGSALLMCFFTALITIMIIFYAPAVAAKLGVSLPSVPASGASNVVYLDIERVLEAGMRRSMGQPSGVQDVQAQADKFQADMSAAFHAYSDAGITIVNSKALIQGSAVHDITNEVLARLGLGR